MGKEEGTSRVVGVQCDSSIVEKFSALDSQYTFYSLHFKTASTAAYSESPNPQSFEIDGYGYLPHECHNTSHSECDIQLNDTKTFTIRALSTDWEDAWAFTIFGDIGDLLSYETVTGGKHFDPFPAVMNNNGYDVEETYALEINHVATECYFVHFQTLVASSNTAENFFVDGYGPLPNECYSKQGAGCDIKICGRRTLVMRAFTTDEWQFEISGDVGRQYDYKTVPKGTHNETVATMDIDKYDYLQVYELLPYSCIHRAISGNQCEREHCSALCNLVPLVSFSFSNYILFQIFTRATSSHVNHYCTVS